MLRKIGRVKEIDQDQEGVDVPPGQFVTEKFPVLTFGSTPEIDLAAWRFTVFGLAQHELVLDWEEFRSLPSVTVEAPFHCVTQWSKLQNTWEGVPFSEVAKLANPRSDASYAMVHCYEGHSTNLALDVLMDDDVLFAFGHDGAPLSVEHGGPLRLVVPKRYGYKSAKWVNGVEFMAEDRPGFWEELGYHMIGDPVKEERFWKELM